MNVNELLFELKYFKEGLTEQRWTMDDYIFENDYIKILRIDSSNKAGGSSVSQGKQWSIIFERTSHLFLEELPTFKKLVTESGYIKITPRLRYPNQYGIRFYKMAKNPNIKILNHILIYLFSEIRK